MFTKEDNDNILLSANEVLLNSKGFILFVCHQDGGLEMVEGTGGLSQAETRWLRSWANYYENIKDNEESSSEF